MKQAEKDKWLSLLTELRDSKPPTTETYRYATKQLEKRLVVIEFHDKIVDSKWTFAHGVVVCGDRFSNKQQLSVLQENGRERMIITCGIKYLEGGPRGIYWPPGVFIGTGQLMGKMAHAIRRGDPWRGRGL